jgi:hypothetical protein
MGYRMTIPQATAIHALASYAEHGWAATMTAEQAAGVDVEQIEGAILELEPIVDEPEICLVKSFKQNEVGRIRWTVDNDAGIVLFVYATGEIEEPDTEEMFVHIFPPHAPKIEIRVNSPRQCAAVADALRALRYDPGKLLVHTHDERQFRFSRLLNQI